MQNITTTTRQSISAFQKLIVLACALVIPGVALGADPSVEQILAATENGRGLIVLVGTTDGALESAVAAAGKGDLIVQGVAVSTETAAKARERIDLEKQSGYASVTAQPTLAVLPFNANLANVVVADLDMPGAPSIEEVLRVVHPYGSALVQRKGAWSVTVKPLPAEMDEWTHYDYGAAGNPQSNDSMVGRVKGLQWWVSSYGNAYTTLRLAGGRRFEGVRRTGPYVGIKDDYQARDAFNGLPLWRFDPAKGLFDYYRKHDRTVAANNDIVVGIYNAPGFAEILDARTGQRKLELTEGLRVEESFKQIAHGTPLLELHHVLLGERLVQAMNQDVVSLDAGTGKRQWAYKIPAESYVAFVAVDKDVCVVATSPVARRFNIAYGNYICKLGTLIGLDPATGKVLWTSDAAAGFFTLGILLDKGVVHIADTSPKLYPGRGPDAWTQQNREYGALIAITANDGKTLWKRDMNGVEKEDRFWHNKLRVWNGFVMPSFEKVVRGFDARTGEDGPIIYRMDKVDTTTNRLGFCSVIRGVAKGTVGGKMARFLDFKTGVFDTTSIARGICDEGQFPAYGMIHTGSDQCGCTSMLRGMVGLQCYQDTVAEPIPANERLERGVSVTLTPNPPDAWPMQFADAKRTSAAPSPIRLGEMPQVLATIQVKVPESRGLIGYDWDNSNLRCGSISAPVVAGGLLVAASTDGQTVQGFDAVTGKQRWSYRAAARIDSAPTLARGLVVFGASDGTVTALRASDGALAWRHLLATNRRHLVVDSQVESVWAIHGSVLVRDDKVFTAVGRFNQIDGGVRLVRLDLATGALDAETTIQDQATSEQPRVPARWDIEGRIADILTTNMPGTILYMGPIAIDPQTLAWAHLSLIPGTLGAKAVGKDPGYRWFNGKGPKFFTNGPDWSYETPGLMAFIFAPSTGAIDKRSSTSTMKGQNGWRMFANTSYQQGLGGDRMAVSGHEVIAVRSGVLESHALTDQWLPKASADMPFWKRHVPAGEKIAPNISGIEALAVTPDQIVVATVNNTKAATASEVRIFDRKGTLLGESIKLPKRIVSNGLAIADGRLYIACEDGSIQIVGQK